MSIQVGMHKKEVHLFALLFLNCIGFPPINILLWLQLLFLWYSITQNFALEGISMMEKFCFRRNLNNGGSYECFYLFFLMGCLSF